MTVVSDNLVYEKAKHSIINDSLNQIAINFDGQKRKHLRYWAILHLKDQETLEKVALNDVIPAIREEAVRKIKNQELLTKIALYDTALSVRMVATSQISDLKSLLLLRIQAEPELQTIISQKLQNIRKKEENMPIDYVYEESDL